MEQSSRPFGLRLSEGLGVTADRARRILHGAMRWDSGDSSKGEAWSVRLGRHIRFAGGVALDEHF